jgi:hypothetical protein
MPSASGPTQAVHRSIFAMARFDSTDPQPAETAGTVSMKRLVPAARSTSTKRLSLNNSGRVTEFEPNAQHVRLPFED